MSSARHLCAIALLMTVIFVYIWNGSESGTPENPGRPGQPRRSSLVETSKATNNATASPKPEAPPKQLGPVVTTPDDLRKALQPDQLQRREIAAQRQRAMNSLLSLNMQWLKRRSESLSKDGLEQASQDLLFEHEQEFLAHRIFARLEVVFRPELAMAPARAVADGNGPFQMRPIAIPATSQTAAK